MICNNLTVYIFNFFFHFVKIKPINYFHIIRTNITDGLQKYHVDTGNTKLLCTIYELLLSDLLYVVNRHYAKLPRNHPWINLKGRFFFLLLLSASHIIKNPISLPIWHLQEHKTPLVIYIGEKKKINKKLKKWKKDKNSIIKKLKNYGFKNEWTR